MIDEEKKALAKRFSDTLNLSPHDGNVGFGKTEAGLTLFVYLYNNKTHDIPATFEEVPVVIKKVGRIVAL